MSRVIRSKELTIGDSAKFSPKIRAKLPQTFRNIVPERIEMKPSVLNVSEHDIAKHSAYENFYNSQAVSLNQGNTSIRPTSPGANQQVHSNQPDQMYYMETPGSQTEDLNVVQPSAKKLTISKTHTEKNHFESNGNFAGESVLSNSNLMTLDNSGHDIKGSKDQRPKSSQVYLYSMSPEHQKFKTSNFGLSPAKRFFSKAEAVSLKKPLTLSFKSDSKKKIPLHNHGTSTTHQLTSKSESKFRKNNAPLPIITQPEPLKHNFNSMTEQNLISNRVNPHSKQGSQNNVLAEVYEEDFLQPDLSHNKYRTTKNLDEEFDRIFNLELPSRTVSPRFPPGYFKERLLMMKGPQKFPLTIHSGAAKTFRKVIRVQNSKYR